MGVGKARRDRFNDFWNDSLASKESNVEGYMDGSETDRSLGDLQPIQPGNMVRLKTCMVKRQVRTCILCRRQTPPVAGWILQGKSVDGSGRISDSGTTQAILDEGHEGATTSDDSVGMASQITAS